MAYRINCMRTNYACQSIACCPRGWVLLRHEKFAVAEAGLQQPQWLVHRGFEVHRDFTATRMAGVHRSGGCLSVLGMVLLLCHLQHSDALRYSQPSSGLSSQSQLWQNAANMLMHAQVE